MGTGYFKTKKNPVKRGSGGSCVIRTTSIHEGFKSVFLQYPHLCPQSGKCAHLFGTRFAPFDQHHSQPRCPPPAPRCNVRRSPSPNRSGCRRGGGEIGANLFVTLARRSPSGKTNFGKCRLSCTEKTGDLGSDRSGFAQQMRPSDSGLFLQ